MVINKMNPYDGCIGMALFVGPCSDLSCWAMWPHTKCSELPIPPFSWTRSSPCTLYTHLHHAETCLCSGWPLNLEWPPFVDPLTFSGIPLSTSWFYLVMLGLGAPLSRPLEEALYKRLYWMNEWINQYGLRILQRANVQKLFKTYPFAIDIED